MAQPIRKPVARDQALDYLFQISAEEHFETLRVTYTQSQERTGLLNRIRQWIKGVTPQHECYPSEYYTLDPTD